MAFKKIVFTLSLLATSFVRADCCPEECTCYPPSARPEICNGSDLYITGEFLWWTARETGLALAADGIVTNIANAPLSHSGKVEYVDFKWRPGFKVGLGLNLDHDCWDIYANYTWFHGEGGNHSISATPAEPLRPSLLTSPSISRVINMEGSWKLHFNVIDLELARNFYVSKCLALRPFAGLKGTWQKQMFHAKAVAQQEFVLEPLNPPLNPLIIIALLTFREQFKERFGGVGLRAGLDSNWYFTRHWGMYADISASAVWGRFNNRTKFNLVSDTEIFNLGTTPVTTENVRDKFDTVLPVLEMGLGLKWENWFSCDEYHIEADVGWENQIWFAMNDFFPSTLDGINSNLVLYGLTAKLRLDF